MSRHVVLVARALGASTAPVQLAKLAARVATGSALPVHAAFLDHGAPALHEVLDRCRADAQPEPNPPDGPVTEIVVIPVQLPADPYLQTWTRKTVSHWLATRQSTSVDPDPQERPLPTIWVTGSFAADEALTHALAAFVSGPIESATAPASSAKVFRSPAWSAVPTHRHQVLICRGTRCSAAGSAHVANRLHNQLRARGLLDAALVADTSCLVPCNLAPLLVVHPPGTWYGPVTPQAVDRLVEDHLANGRPLPDLEAGQLGEEPDKPAHATVEDPA